MLLAMLFLSFNEWTLTGLDLYDKLLPIRTAVDEKGNLFIADSNRAVIHLISSDGRKLKEFGGKGQAPGELYGITCIQYYKSKLYVFDIISRTIQAFSEDGEVLGKFRAPRTQLNGWYYPLFKTDKGWLVLGYKVIRLMSDTFEEEEAFLGDLQAEIEYRNRNRTLYNPSPDNFLFAIDQMYNRVVVYVPGEGFQLQVYSLATLEHEETVKIPGKLVPFDKDYGMDNLEAFQSRNSGRPWLEDRLKLDPPKYFRPFTIIGALPTGEFHIMLGNSLLPNEKRNIFLDKNLSPTETPSHRKGDCVVLNYFKSFVFIASPDDEGELVVEKLKLVDYLNPEFKRP